MDESGKLLTEKLKQAINRKHVQLSVVNYRCLDTVTNLFKYYFFTTINFKIREYVITDGEDEYPIIVLMELPTSSKEGIAIAPQLDRYNPSDKIFIECLEKYIQIPLNPKLLK